MNALFSGICTTVLGIIEASGSANVLLLTAFFQPPPAFVVLYYVLTQIEDS